jgi:hypothetical protein
MPDPCCPLFSAEVWCHPLYLFRKRVRLIAFRTQFENPPNIKYLIYGPGLSKLAPLPVANHLGRPQPPDYPSRMQVPFSDVLSKFLFFFVDKSTLPCNDFSPELQADSSVHSFYASEPQCRL